MPAGLAPAGLAPTGLAIVDKPAGWTSHDVVARCRGIFATRRVGHAGTLDPDATGVLLVGVGPVTRLLRFLSALTKRYTGELVLGVATSTLDASGEVVGTWDMSSVDEKRVRAAAADLTGKIQQVPPMVSAVKVGGRRLHQLAREGLEVDREARPVEVRRFDVVSAGRPGVYRFDVECSAGTYVRALAADLGAALGGGAHLGTLRRTAVGSFADEEAVPLERLTAADLLTPADALRDYARVEVNDEVAAAVGHGKPLDRASLDLEGDGPWPLVNASGQLLAVYEPYGEGRVKPAVVVPGDR